MNAKVLFSIIVLTATISQFTMTTTVNAAAVPVARGTAIEAATIANQTADIAIKAVHDFKAEVPIVDSITNENREILRKHKIAMHDAQWHAFKSAYEASAAAANARALGDAEGANIADAAAIRAKAAANEAQKEASIIGGKLLTERGWVPMFE